MMIDKETAKRIIKLLYKLLEQDTTNIEINSLLDILEEEAKKCL